MKSFWFVLWIVLGLFSLVGLGGWSEIFPSLDIWDDDIFMVLVLFPLNFILCHFISYHIFKNIHFGLARFNYILFMLPIAVAVPIIELALTFLLFDYFTDFYDPIMGMNGFFIPFIFFITCLIVFAYGGFPQLVQHIIRAASAANEDFFNGLQQNAINNALNRAKKNNEKKSKQ
ncbi:hypothetical protein OAI16_04345 [Flavobacteriaceae bacterium]|nr:hypothetical protein [Flavobacteriaceae bacterium]MDC0117109.1 hypothetical protein [Flavobacteriaceae bacterium]